MATKKDSSLFIWGKRTALESIYPQRKKKKGPPKRYGEHVESTILKKKMTFHTLTTWFVTQAPEVLVRNQSGGARWKLSPSSQEAVRKRPTKRWLSAFGKDNGKLTSFCAYCITDGASTEMGFGIMETCTHAWRRSVWWNHPREREASPGDTVGVHIE